MRVCIWVGIGGILLASALSGQVVTTVNSAAGMNPNTGIVPGSLVNILGSSLAGGLASADSVALSTTLGDVSAVTFNDKAVPIVAVSDGQITVQAPWDLTTGESSVVVKRGDAASAPVTVKVNEFAPAVYSLSVGRSQAMAVNGDGSLAAPAGSFGALAAHPAAAGDTLTIWATGLGPVHGGVASGALPSDDSATVVTMPTVMVGGVQAEVKSATLSQKAFGVYQIVITVPEGIKAGKAVPVQIQVNGTTSLDPVTIALQ